MVRFGDVKLISEGRTTSLFQFQYGAIWRALNSSRVFIFSEFQFQYGAIWSAGTASSQYVVLLFQFQYGAIWRLNFTNYVDTYMRFQFQYGAIWSSPLIIMSAEKFSVSIPVWCDLEALLLLLLF